MPWYNLVASASVSAHYSSFVHRVVVETGMMRGYDSSANAHSREGYDGQNCFDWSGERRVYAQSV